MTPSRLRELKKEFYEEGDFTFTPDVIEELFAAVEDSFLFRASVGEEIVYITEESKLLGG
jgi:hypothetical protein